MRDYNDMPKTQMDRLQRDRRAVQHKAISAAKDRVAEAALKAVPSSCSELPDPELVRDFQAALDDLRRLKGEG